MPIVRDPGELHQLEGQIIQVVGEYYVVDTSPHSVMYQRPDGTHGTSKRIVRLAVDDVDLELWVRPDDEMAAFDGKVVKVTGKLYLGGGKAKGPGAQMDTGPTLVDITDVREE